MNDVCVYLTGSAKVKNLLTILIVLTLPMGLFAYGWLFRSVGEMVLLTGFGVFVAGGTLFALRNSSLWHFRSTPVLIFHANGMEIPPDTLLPWDIFKDAVVFTHEGQKTIGMRLRNDLDSETRDAIVETFQD